MSLQKQSTAGAVGTAGDERENGNSDSKYAMQVIVLGPTGGPREDRVTGILVRPLASGWAPHSMVAVDAGTLLCGIIDILDDCEIEDGSITSGPFAGLRLPHKGTSANAAYIFQRIIGAILITHAHLDHVSALAINSPILETGSGPKTVAALPSVVGAIKAHVFNDIIWPNLSDEDGGAGLITYQRLIEGGNPIMGRGELRGYVRAGDGLLTRCFGVSHGRCKARIEDDYHDIFRRASSVRLSERHRMSASMPGTRTSSDAFLSPYSNSESTWTAIDSSAFFIRDEHTGAEIIIFGDVEPDSLSLNPRNRRVWEVAAPKLARSQLRAIFIECSYNEDVEDEFLFGHLCPRHLVKELSVLARFVADEKGIAFPATAKRKRSSSGQPNAEPLSPKSKRSTISGRNRHSSNQSPHRNGRRSVKRTDETEEGSDSPVPSSSLDSNPLRRKLSAAKYGINGSKDVKCGADLDMPLFGLSIYLIHIKDDMSDGPHPREQILQELTEQGQAAGLGCKFHVPKRGESIYI
ncbi:cAMP phosphodiesterases class-II-domain-containing protein [Aspergillus egyptiacus]|nr:cAMP phosphodiesterases class-II-domain-containing protein [Aspergillus egyptiacus]